VKIVLLRKLTLFGGVSPKGCVVLGSFNFYCTVPKIIMAIRRNDLLLLYSKVTPELEVVTSSEKLRRLKNWKESVRYFNGGSVKPRDCMLMLARTTLNLYVSGFFDRKN
jgi:hypothetical protein